MLAARAKNPVGSEGHKAQEIMVEALLEAGCECKLKDQVRERGIVRDCSERLISFSTAS